MLSRRGRITKPSGKKIGFCLECKVKPPFPGIDWLMLTLMTREEAEEQAQKARDCGRYEYVELLECVRLNAWIAEQERKKEEEARLDAEEVTT